MRHSPLFAWESTLSHALVPPPTSLSLEGHFEISCAFFPMVGCPKVRPHALPLPPQITRHHFRLKTRSRARFSLVLDKRNLSSFLSYGMPSSLLPNKRGVRAVRPFSCFVVPSSRLPSFLPFPFLFNNSGVRRYGMSTIPRDRPSTHVGLANRLKWPVQAAPDPRMVRGQLPGGLERAFRFWNW